MPTTKSYELTGPGPVTFEPIELAENMVGKTYTYTITETMTGFPAKGWSQTDPITAYMHVTDDGEGNLVGTVTYKAGDTITNTYNSSGEFELNATKAIEGADWPSGKTITFTLSAEDGGSLPKTLAYDLTEPGDASWKIQLSEEDAGKTYTYTISETTEFGTGWTPSGEITATVHVTDEGDGNVTAKVTYDPIDQTIMNTYKAGGEFELQATKAIEGAD